jgi:hypothetical protein
MRCSLRFAFAAFVAALAVAAKPVRAAEDAAARSAIARMQQPGPEAEALARRAGVWNVVVTLRPAPEAAPIVTSGLVAERTMIGLFLQEVMKPAPGSTVPDFRRISYLHYNRVESRWQYVSLDTRFPAGIMPARSFEKETRGNLTLQFDGLAFAGWGDQVEGWLMRSNYVISREGDDHEFARQFWTRADGTGREWLAVQYEYTRKR